MDLKSAEQFQAHMEEAIKQLSSALYCAREEGSAEEFLAITKSVGEIIARMDGVLHEFIHRDHPGLRWLDKK
jgi:hypothetical protein